MSNLMAAKGLILLFLCFASFWKPMLAIQCLCSNNNGTYFQNQNEMKCKECKEQTSKKFFGCQQKACVWCQECFVKVSETVTFYTKSRFFCFVGLAFYSKKK